MTEQPTALLLAEKLEQQFPVGTAQRYLDGEAAAELRRLHQSEREGWRYADELEQERKRLHSVNAQLLEALELAEAGLADIGDADREPGDDLEWCERRAAKPLPVIRAAIAAAKGAA